MRSAELLGLTPNGKFLLVVTDSGEELAIAADDRLRAALRGDRPRLGQLEIEMDSALTPREIQTRVRAGEDVADIARAAGMELDRVERFAAPVLAERDHIARQARASSARRRGETSAARGLQHVVDERLRGRGVDADSVEWDAFRQADGRWVVTATYTSGEAERQAQFHYDPLNRFSLASNDEGHWILGDSSASKGPQPGRRRQFPGGHVDSSEPTLDLSDELALVRVVQDATDAEDVPADQAMPSASVEAASAESVENTVPVPPLRVVEGGWEPPIVVNYPVEPGPAEDASDEPTRTDAPTDIEDRRDERHEFDEEHQEPEPEPEPESVADPAPSPRPQRRKRASVPSWDEIMFGGRDGSGR